MKNIFLVRHGESSQNVGINEKERIPDHAVYLTSNGKKQAFEAGKWLKNYLDIQGINKYDTRVWVSPYRRTRQTAEQMNISLQINNIREDDMLVELQFGLFDNISDEEAASQFPAEWAYYENCKKYNGKFYARKPCGESPFDVEKRMRLFISSIYRDFQNGGPDNLIVIGHGASNRLLVKAFFHYTHEWYESDPNPDNCWIRQIQISHKGNKDLGYIYTGCS